MSIEDEVIELMAKEIEQYEISLYGDVAGKTKEEIIEEFYHLAEENK